jgi:hypothetical protein
MIFMITGHACAVWWVRRVLWRFREEFGTLGGTQFQIGIILQGYLCMYVDADMYEVRI